MNINDRNFIHKCTSCQICASVCPKEAISINLNLDGFYRPYIDKDKCVGCYTCILSCPYGAISHSETGAIQKCELCTKNAGGVPQCVKGCPNGAIVFEER